jgi:hypothetical protein
VKDAHEPGSAWEEGVTDAGAPGVERLAVSAGELGEPEERLDALPLALAGDPGVQGPSRLAGGGAGPRILRPDPDDAEEGAPPALEVGGGLVLGLAELLEQRLEERSVASESGRDMELEPGGCGHRPVLAEELGGLLCDEGLSADPARAGPEAWPLLASPDEPGGDGIGEDVDHLLEDGGGRLQANGAVAVGVPEGLPAAEGAVDGPGSESIQVPVELGQPGVRVAEDKVEVVREDAEGVDADAEAFGGDAQKIPEDVVGPSGWLEEEAALGAAAGDEVGGSGQDLSRESHGSGHSKADADRSGRDFGRLEGSHRPRCGHVVRGNFPRSGRRMYLKFYGD